MASAAAFGFAPIAIADAVAAIRAARRPDGTWLQEHRLPGAVWFDEDVPVGEPSKWLTFHAVRAPEWWDRAHGGV